MPELSLPHRGLSGVGVVCVKPLQWVVSNPLLSHRGAHGRGAFCQIHVRV